MRGRAHSKNAARTGTWAINSQEMEERGLPGTLLAEPVLVESQGRPMGVYQGGGGLRRPNKLHLNQTPSIHSSNIRKRSVRAARIINYYNPREKTSYRRSRNREEGGKVPAGVNAGPEYSSPRRGARLRVSI